MNGLTNNLKIFLVLLAGSAMTLTACSDISTKRLQSVVSVSPARQSYSSISQTGGSSAALEEVGNRSGAMPTATRSSNSGKTSSVSRSLVGQPNQILSQNNSSAETTVSRVQVKREDYKPIGLSEIADANALRGNDPKAIALSAFGKTELEGGSRDVTVDYPQPNLAVVIITQMGLADDSVRGIRYRAELMPTTKSSQAGKQWEIVWAGSQVTCQPGRGHQDWSTKLCL